MLKTLDITARVNQLESNIGIEPEDQTQEYEFTQRNEESQTLDNLAIKSEAN